MGMFDSLYIELDGKEIEIQTKRFDCALDHYRVGDWIDGAPPGIRTYFDVLHLGADGAPVYGTAVEPARTLTLFFVIAHGVFVEYESHDGELSAEVTERTLKELRARWSDSARLLAFLVDALRERQQACARLEYRIGRVASVVQTVCRLRSGETVNAVFGLIDEADRRLADGEDPIEVMAWVLRDETSGWGRWGIGTKPDPLDDYRL